MDLKNDHNSSLSLKPSSNIELLVNQFNNATPENKNALKKFVHPNSDHVVVSVSIDFPTKSQQEAPFHRITYDYSRADWDDQHYTSSIQQAGGVVSCI